MNLTLILELSFVYNIVQCIYNVYLPIIFFCRGFSPLQPRPAKFAQERLFEMLTGIDAENRAMACNGNQVRPDPVMRPSHVEIFVDSRE